MTVSLSELHELAAGVMDETITDDRFARLCDLLHQDQAAQRFFVRYVDLHATLRSGIARTLVPKGVPTAHSTAALSASEAVLKNRFPLVRVAFNSPLAASLLIAALVYGMFGYLAWNLRPDKPPEHIVGREVVATVSQVADVRWSPASTHRSTESQLREGEPLKIESGTMELELTAGTKLIVDGPAEWSVDGDNRVTLKGGKIVAKVPARAIGFSVTTPTAKIVDLGTEFGVDVDEQGEAEVHVFQGRVVAERAVSSSTAPQRIELKKSEAARFTRNQTVISRFSAAPERFQRGEQLAATKQVRVLPSLLGGLQLWLKADGGVYSTFSDDGDFSNDLLAKVGDRVQAWRDFSDYHRDATQAISDAQPVLVTNKHGWLSLRFNGDDWLERAGEVLPPNGPQFTIFVVFQPNFLSPDFATALFGQFNNVNGAGHSNRFLNVQVGGQFVYDEYESPGGKALSSAARSISKDQIYVGCATKNGVNRALKVFSDNDTISVSDSAAEVYIGPPPRCWRLGSRQLDDNPCFLNGDIAEVMIFDRALDEKSRQHLETYLIAKYLNKSAVGNAPNGEPAN
jgi:hypothetical protein